MVGTFLVLAGLQLTRQLGFHVAGDVDLLEVANINKD